MYTNSDLNYLQKVTRTIPIRSGHSYSICKAEEIILSTSVLQRMRRLRQMGLAYHAFPLAEHSRFIHSIGTAYWSNKMLESMFNSRKKLLKHNTNMFQKMNDVLGEQVSINLIIRLYSLIHDVGLIPLGHTLRLQLDRFTSDSNFSSSFGSSINIIRNEFAEACRRDGIEQALTYHLALAEAAAHAPRILRNEDLPSNLLFIQTLSEEILGDILPVLSFIYDLVHGVYAADLLDWCGRDLDAIGGVIAIPDSLLNAGAIVEAKPGTDSYPVKAMSSGPVLFRYGIDCYEKGSPGVIALYQLASLHRARLEVIVCGTYSLRKRIADAMLDKSFRILSEEGDASINAFGGIENLLKIGDDEFMTMLSSLVSKYPRRNPSAELSRGRLYHAGFESKINSSVISINSEYRDISETVTRTSIEQNISNHLGIGKDDIIFSTLPADMQGKEPTTLVRINSEGWLPLSQLAARTGLVPDMSVFTNEYKNQNRITVLIHPDVQYSSKKLVRYCNSFFK